MKRLTRLDIIEILLALAAIGSVDSGLDGAALGFAIIAACCIVMITWIEITRFKRNDNQ